MVLPKKYIDGYYCETKDEVDALADKEDYTTQVMEKLERNYGRHLTAFEVSRKFFMGRNQDEI